MTVAPVQPTAPTTRESAPLTDVGVRVSVSRDLAATVVVLDGVVGPNDCDLVEQRIPAPSDTAGVTIVDLNNVTLLDRYAFHRLLKKLSPPGEKVKLVCRRSTGRHLLRAWRLHERFDVFATIETALHRSEVRTN